MKFNAFYGRHGFKVPVAVLLLMCACGVMSVFAILCTISAALTITMKVQEDRAA